MGFQKKYQWPLYLLLTDPLVLLLLVSSAQALPRKLRDVEVHQHVAQTLQVVAPTLFYPLVRVDARVPRCSRQILPLLVWYVLSHRISILLCQTKVDDIALVVETVDAHQKVIRFNVSVDKVAAVHELYAR